ncbi:MAG: hypothetical protein AABY22_35500 [Nanoarchaeota archaeon]
MIKLNAPQIGMGGQLRVCSELLFRGFNPAMFFFDNGIDIILDNGKRIGVKTSINPIYGKKNYSYKYSFSLNVPRFRIGKNGNYKRELSKKNYCNIIDFWIFWCIKDNLFYIIPSNKIKNVQKISIVISTPKDKRIYKKIINKVSISKYEKYKNNWEQLR